MQRGSQVNVRYTQNANTRTQARPPPPASGAGVGLAAGWEEHYDETYKRPFWFNTITDECTWDRPPGFSLASTQPARYSFRVEDMLGRYANVHDVMPMVMERDEAREEMRKKAKEMGVEMRKNEMARKDHFRGPCKDVCKQYCACCVSADGRTLYGCVPIASSYDTFVHSARRYGATLYGHVHFTYLLPLCLHVCLCPQQGCDPCPLDVGETDECGERCAFGVLQLLFINPFLCCSQAVAQSCCSSTFFW